MNNDINTLITTYPDIEWSDITRETLIEIAKLYLAQEHAKLFADSGVKRNYLPEEGRSAVALLERVHVSQKKRMQARSRERVMFDRKQVEATVSNRISEIVRDARATIRSEWTSVLDQTFKLPGGGEVSWREATAEQHAQRAEFLEKRAASELESASLHRKASADIRSAGVRSLGEIQSISTTPVAD